MAGKKPTPKPGKKPARKTSKRPSRRHLAVRQTLAQEGLTHITRHLAWPLWVTAVVGILMLVISFLEYYG